MATQGCSKAPIYPNRWRRNDSRGGKTLKMSLLNSSDNNKVYKSTSQKDTRYQSRKRSANATRGLRERSGPSSPDCQSSLNNVPPESVSRLSLASDHQLIIPENSYEKTQTTWSTLKSRYIGYKTTHSLLQNGNI